MILVIVDEPLRYYTAGNEFIECKAGSASQALLHVFNVYPQLFAYVQSENLPVSLIHNDECILEVGDMGNPMADGDTIHMLVAPRGSAMAIGEAVIEFAAEYGVISASTWAAAGTVTYIVIGAIVLAGISVALQAIMGSLSGDVELPSIASGSLDNSATYTFDGVKNTTAAGTAIQIVYGTHRTGGHIIAVRLSETSANISP